MSDEIVIREDIDTEVIIAGVEGAQGIQGETGPSAYDGAVANGFVGTEQEWLAQLGSELVNAHINNATPHPAYDDLPSLNILFENGLI